MVLQDEKAEPKEDKTEAKAPEPEPVENPQDAADGGKKKDEL